MKRAVKLFFLLSSCVVKAHPLVTVVPGELPIILSAPHGGREVVPDVPPRQGKDVKLFKTGADTNTDKLAEELAIAIAKTTGKRPYVVIARFQRQFIDANRPPEYAYESDTAKPAYEAYHAALAALRQEITAKWGSGILLDLHGQAMAPKTIFRGTMDGKTTLHLTDNNSKAALIGEKSLFGRLAEQGLKVAPPVASSDVEKFYNGGYIVGTYGSAEGGTFDAIQLELGTAMRADAERPKTVEKLAAAVTHFAKDYLPQAEIDPTAKKIVVGVYHDEGAGPSVNDLTRTLSRFDGVEVQKLKAEDIRGGKLKGVNVLIQPGGSGGGQGRHLEVGGRENIREFVRQGGGYIGICAGAYLATTHYSWSLGILDAKVVDSKHWARGKGTVEMAMTAQGKEILKNANDVVRVHYAQGPLLAPGNNADIPDYETLSTFKTEVALNGAPKGVMLGTTAAAQGKFGNGRVLCLSPHPEMTKGLETMVRHAIEAVKPAAN